jgi:IS30 family transposase
MSTDEACVQAGVSRRTGYRWNLENDGRPPPGLFVKPGRYLGLAERQLIADLHRAEESVTAIARRLGRPASTVSRELRRNAEPCGRYRPYAAQVRADQRRARPRQGKIGGNERLRERVQELLTRCWSPEQISAHLRIEFPDQAEMQVCHETIYQALYVQGRGGLRRELAACLRTGRAVRKRRRRGDERRVRFVEPMVMISDRPAEAADRAVPGHWEGDLIVGALNRSAIGTLVERSTRFTLLLHLPGRHDCESVRDAIVEAITDLPVQLRRSLTWDQGAELALHHQIRFASGLPVYFCEPGSPWQRGTNENTNGLLRQYFPKGTDLSVYSKEHLVHVAAELNARPRKTLGWRTPAQALQQLLSENQPRCDDH